MADWEQVERKKNETRQLCAERLQQDYPWLCATCAVHYVDLRENSADDYYEWQLPVTARCDGRCVCSQVSRQDLVQGKLTANTFSLTIRRDIRMPGEYDDAEDRVGRSLLQCHTAVAHAAGARTEGVDRQWLVQLERALQRIIIESASRRRQRKGQRPVPCSQGDCGNPGRRRS